MKKDKINIEMLCKKISNKSKKAFTLVELIIVITILAILSTIAFISFKSYTGNARDSVRLSALNNIQKGLELFQATSGTLPMPDGQINTGILNGETLFYVGNIGENISRIIKFSKIPLDPLSNTNYVYGVSADKKYYQVASTQEYPLSYTTSIIKTAYADTYYAKVVGNYKYPLKLGNKLYSIPSLIYVGSGTITDSSTGFVINGGENIAYSLDNKTVINTKTAQDNLKQIIGTSETLSITGITIPSITSKEFRDLTTIPIELRALLITDKDLLGQIIYGTNYFTNDNFGVISWKDIPGNENCTNDDYVFYLSGTIYRWAGCNSYRGTTGLSSDTYNGTCYDYNSSPTTCTNMNFTDKENSYNPTYGEDNIWGKLYLWSKAVEPNNACPTGWHVPTDDEFEKLETYLNGGTNCRNGTDGWLCDGLGWSGKSSKTSSNNMIKALKLPLAGHWRDGTFYTRGYNTDLWSSTNTSSTGVFARSLEFSSDQVFRYNWDSTTRGFSVRCIKDL